MANIDLSYGGFNLRINYSISQNPVANTSYVSVDSIQCYNGDQSTVYAVYLESGYIRFNGVDMVSFGGGAYFMPVSNTSFNNVAGVWPTGGITVGHGAGGEGAAVSVSAQITYRYEVYSSSSNFYGSGTVYTPSITFYWLGIDNQGGATASVVRTWSAVGAGTGAIGSGTKLFPNDTLQVVFTPAPNYEVDVHTVNGSPFASGGTLSVWSNISVVARGKILSNTFIGNDRYLTFIDSGSGFQQYLAYLDTGSEWIQV